MELREQDYALLSDRGLPCTVVNVVRDEFGRVVEYWVELHEWCDGYDDKVVIASPEDVRPLA